MGPVGSAAIQYFPASAGVHRHRKPHPSVSFYVRPHPCLIARAGGVSDPPWRTAPRRLPRQRWVDLHHQRCRDEKRSKTSPACCGGGGGRGGANQRTERRVLISDLIDTLDVKPEGKLFQSVRNVLPKPRLNSLTNFQQQCLKRGKHR